MYDNQLKNAESTAQFCCTVNDMLDAMNRTWKNSLTGFTLDCKDKQVISYKMEML